MTVHAQQTPSPLLRFGRAVVVAIGALLLALGCFLVLPLLQAISNKPKLDLSLTSIETAELPPPPPVEQEPEKEPPKEEKPPKLCPKSAPIAYEVQTPELAASSLTGAGIRPDFATRSAVPNATA